MKQSSRNTVEALAIGLCVILMVTSSLSSAVTMRSKTGIPQDDYVATFTHTENTPLKMKEKTTVKLLVSDTSGLLLENTVDKNDLMIKPISVNDKTYYRLSYSDCFFTTEVGKPELPMMITKVAIPKDVEITLKVTPVESTTLSHYDVYPVPELKVTTNSDGVASADEKFCIDTTFYSTNTVYPGPLAKISSISYIRDLRFAQLEIYPLQYNPRSGEITFYSSLKIEIKYNRPIDSADLKFPATGPLDDICTRTILNYDSSSQDSSTSQNGNPLLSGTVTYPENLSNCNNAADYLILTSDFFYNASKLDLPISPIFKPLVEITSPSNQGIITRVTMIHGNARDDDKIERVDIRLEKLAPPPPWSHKDSIYFGENHGDVPWEYLASFPGSGIYLITVKAFDGVFYSDEASIFVHVQTNGYHPPVAVASPKYQEIQVGEKAFFDGSKSYCPDGCNPEDPLTYRWSISDVVFQPVLSGMRVNYTFTEPGNYIVSLFVSDGGHPFSNSTSGSMDKCIVRVTESPINHPPFAIATPFYQVGIVDENLVFNGSQSHDPDNNSLEYLWDFGDGTTGSGPLVTHRFLKPGTGNSPSNSPNWNFTVTLTVTDGLLSDKDVCLVIIRDTILYQNTLNELAHWRAGYNNFTVSVISINNPFIGGNNYTKIKHFIDYVYDNWSAPHMNDNHVGYILLVGDLPFVTSHMNYNVGYQDWYPTDKYYVCIVGNDTYPDAMIGRFSIDDWSELYTVSEKTINYEKNPEPGDWQKNVLLCEGLRSYPYAEGNQFPEYTRIKETLLGLGGWNVTEVFWEDGGTAEDIINKINDGQRIVVYRDHGGPQDWCFIDFNVNHVRQLTNGNRLPLVYSLACSTGSFQEDNDCLGEEFLNNPNGGAIAFWGSSMVTGNDAPFFTHLFDSMFENFSYIIGKIITEGIIKMNGGFAEFNLLGDPAVDLSGSTRYPSKPDLAISPLNITLDPENPTPEDHEICVTATVLNIGGGAARNVNIQFIVEDMFGDMRIIGEQVIPEIQPRGRSTLTQLWNTSKEPAKKSLVVRIDPNNTIDEAYELNNQAGATVVIPSDVTYVDDDYYDGGANDGHTWGYDAFNKIQDGIDVVAHSGNVIVHPGMYYEHLTIKKTITLQGDNRDTTIIDGNETGKVITLIGTKVNISGFTIQHSGQRLFDSGIYIISSYPDFKGDNNISGNTITENLNGVCLAHSCNNTITENNIIDNDNGIYLYSATSGNKIIGNTIIENNYGFYDQDDTWYCPNDIYIIHNNFINNNINAYDRYFNTWDNGYPSGGNYWADWASNPDNYHGPMQNISGSDGIIDKGSNPGNDGRKPYIIAGKNPPNRDWYPLKYPFIPG